MKLKSLLLGSAAALALTSGALAADPRSSFVSLDVCDAYGITGLTIASADTCLLISGEVEYDFSYDYDAATTTWASSSTVDWELAFEATTQTDSGAAKAVITLVDGPLDTVDFGDVYVSFGDTTVLSAGKKGSLFDADVDGDFLDWGHDTANLVNTVATGGHVIQIESLVADGFTVLLGLEDLNGDGTLGAGIEYDNGGVNVVAGVLVGDIFGNVPGFDPVNFYVGATASFDNFSLLGQILVDDTGYWLLTGGASATFDMFTLTTEAWIDEVSDWGVGVEGTFDATDTVAITVGAYYEDEVGVEYGNIYVGADVDVTDTITLSAEVGYEGWSVPASDVFYGELALGYAPGGDFEAEVGFNANSDGDYGVSFTASKSF